MVLDMFPSNFWLMYPPQFTEALAYAHLGGPVRIGPKDLPAARADTARLSILNAPVPKDGFLVSIRLRLGGVPPSLPGHNSSPFEARIYENLGDNEFQLHAVSTFCVDRATLEEQRVSLLPPLGIKKGEVLLFSVSNSY